MRRHFLARGHCDWQLTCLQSKCQDIKFGMRHYTLNYISLNILHLRLACYACMHMYRRTFACSPETNTSQCFSLYQHYISTVYVDGAVLYLQCLTLKSDQQWEGDSMRFLLIFLFVLFPLFLSFTPPSFFVSHNAIPLQLIDRNFVISWFIQRQFCQSTRPHTHTHTHTHTTYTKHTNKTHTRLRRYLPFELPNRY
jgi:hypothetical protein